MGFATAVTIAGIGAQTYGALEQGSAGRAEQERNAQIAEQNAAYAKRKSEFEQLRAGKAAREGMGRLRAKQGAAGARLDVGAPVAAAAEQWGEYMLNKWIIGEEGRIETEGWLNQAELSRTRGRNIQSASYWRAGKSLLTGFGTMRREGMLEFGKPSTGPRLSGGGSPYSGTRRFTSSVQR